MPINKDYIFVVIRKGKNEDGFKWKYIESVHRNKREACRAMIADAVDLVDPCHVSDLYIKKIAYQY